MPAKLPTLNHLRFLWHYRRNRLAHALARQGRADPVSQRALWAMYRLGMHASVAAAQVRETGWQGRFAQAVSRAACGQTEAACEAVEAYLRCSTAGEHLVDLAIALAPYLPSLALQLLQGRTDIPPALHAGLLLRTGQIDAARRLLQALPHDAEQALPELALVRTNAWGGSPDEQLKRLNAFLQAHGVSPLQLRDPSNPPSPVNLVAASPEAEVGGPLVTVLMTTFHTGERASAAIESVLAQRYRNLELIVVDDASQDRTPEAIQYWAERDSRVHVVRLRRNVGTYAAKRIGLARAQGEFVTCHDSDDWSHPEKIARQVAPLLADKGLVCTVSNLVRMQDDGLLYARPVYPLMRLNPSSLLFRRQQVEREAGTWDCVRTGADSEFLARLRIVFGPQAMMKICQPLSLGSHRPDSLMTGTGTGYSASGMSPQRLAYWEAWSWWHIENLSQGLQPRIPADLCVSARLRPFPVPESLRVSSDDIEHCLSSLEP